MSTDSKNEVKQLQEKTNQIEGQVMGERAKRVDATQLVIRFKQQLNVLQSNINRESESKESHMAMLQLQIRNSDKEKEKMYQKIRQIQHEIDAQKDKYEYQIENMQFQSKEVESNYRLKIQETLQQVRQLREFQEKKHQLDEQMREISNLITKERKQFANEISSIHKKIAAQREYYEKMLSEGLDKADAFSTTLHNPTLDEATTILMQTTDAKREELKTESSLMADVIKRNDQLRHQLQDLEQQRRVVTQSEKALTTQAVDLKAKMVDTVRRSEENSQLSKERIDQLKSVLDEKISVLSSRLDNAKKTRDQLHTNIELMTKRVEQAEQTNAIKMQKEKQLFSVLNESALFILTSLELQEQDPSKDDIAKHSSGLNAVIRKISNVSQDLAGVGKKEETPAVPQKAVSRGFVSSGKSDPKKTVTTRAASSTKGKGKK